MAQNNSCNYRPTQYNVQTGGASGALNDVAPSATSGVPLISQGSSSQPVFGTAVVGGGGTGNTTFTAYSIIAAGTTATGAFQNVSGVGTADQVLTSNGASALPTWQNAKFLIANKTLTSAQIKALRATPIEIIAAPGSGKGIVVVSATAKLTYGGTNAFTAAASQTIALYYNNNTTVVNGSLGNLIPNAMITSTANKFSINNSAFVSNNQAAGVLDNVNVAAWNTVATEITGNAANNNTITINVGYYIVTF